MDEQTEKRMKGGFDKWILAAWVFVDYFCMSIHFTLLLHGFKATPSVQVVEGKATVTKIRYRGEGKDLKGEGNKRLSWERSKQVEGREVWEQGRKGKNTCR